MVEKCYLENYLLPDHFANMPDGMIPKVAIRPPLRWAVTLTGDCGFWSNWNNTFFAGSGGTTSLSRHSARGCSGCDYFKPFQNGDELLEKLDGWVFIEWSKSNDYVKDVSYPIEYALAAGSGCRRTDLQTSRTSRASRGFARDHPQSIVRW